MKYFFSFLMGLVVFGFGCVPLDFGLNQEKSTDASGPSHFGMVIQPGDTQEVGGSEDGWVNPRPGPFWWDQIETESGVYDWTAADAEVQRWNQAQQNMLATIWPFAQWDQATCHGNEPKVKHPFGDAEVWLSGVCHIESFERFITALVERYDGDGTDDMPGLTQSVTYWQISQTPDVQFADRAYFQSGPLGYAELLQLSSQAIKRADPSAYVVVGAQANMQDSGTDFFRSALSFARTSFDIASIHSVKDDQGLNAKAYHAFIRGLGFEDRPFWITFAQIGSPDVEDVWDEDETARMMFIGSVQAFADGAATIFFTQPSQEASQHTLTTLTETIGFFQDVDRVAEQAVLFRVGDQNVFALWDNVELPGDYQNEQVEILRYNGTRERVDASTLKADAPMFVFMD